MAIGAAWSIASQQSKRAQEEARRSDLAKCEAVAGVLRHALRIATHEPIANEGTVRVEELLDGIKKTIDSLDRLDVLLLPDPDLVAAIFESKYALERLVKKIRSYDKSFLILYSYQFGMARSCISILETQIEVCTTVISKYA